MIWFYYTAYQQTIQRNAENDPDNNYEIPKINEINDGTMKESTCLALIDYIKKINTVLEVDASSFKHLLTNEGDMKAMLKDVIFYAGQGEYQGKKVKFEIISGKILILDFGQYAAVIKIKPDLYIYNPIMGEARCIKLRVKSWVFG